MEQSQSTGAGKGDRDRSSFSKKYKENYDLIKKSGKDLVWDNISSTKKTKRY